MLSLRFPFSPTATIKNTFSPPPNKPLSPTFPSHTPLTRSHEPNSRLHTPLPKSKNDGVAAAISNVVEEELPRGLQRELLPKHVSCTIDGHRRWCRDTGRTLTEAHRTGRESIRALTSLCAKCGIPYLSLYLFSTENWGRPQVEIDTMFNMYEEMLVQDKEKLNRDNIKVSFIGELWRLPKSLLKIMTEVKELTKDNTGLHFVMLLSYGGQWDILQACKSIANKVKNGQMEPEDIDQTAFEQELETKIYDFPYPDIYIRSSGEQRISNFMLYQMPYTELYFAGVLWPEIGPDKFIEVFRNFQERKRRYGL